MQMITAALRKPSKLLQTLRLSFSRFQVAEKTIATENVGDSLRAEGSNCKSLCSKIQDISRYEPTFCRSLEYC